jgi:hypothetical protein
LATTTLVNGAALFIEPAQDKAQDFLFFLSGSCSILRIFTLITETYGHDRTANPRTSGFAVIGYELPKVTWNNTLHGFLYTSPQFGERIVL